MIKKTMVGLIAIVAIAVVLMSTGCIDNGGDGDGGDRTQTPTPPQQLPDLSVASVEIIPSEPRVGERFTAVVYVVNIGSASSGEYDLAMDMKDVSRGYTYPVGTFRQSPLQPSEQVASWSSDQLMVNEPGAHQFWVEIEPFLFSDGNEQNNMYGWAFTVSS